MRILVMEDEQKLARALKEGLEAEHYVSTWLTPEKKASIWSRLKPSIWWSWM